MTRSDAQILADIDRRFGYLQPVRHYATTPLAPPPMERDETKSPKLPVKPLKMEQIRLGPCKTKRKKRQKVVRFPRESCPHTQIVSIGTSTTIGRVRIRCAGCLLERTVDERTRADRKGVVWK